jgi:hypothetical protein
VGQGDEGHWTSMARVQTMDQPQGCEVGRDESESVWTVAGVGVEVGVGRDSERGCQTMRTGEMGAADLEG